MRHPTTRTALIALSGLSSAAAAGVPSLTISFHADATDGLLAGDTLHWTVSATYTGVSASGYFGGFVGSFLASDPEIGTATNFVNNMSGQGVNPLGDGATVTDINIFNAALLGTDDPSLGVFFEFDVVLGPGSYGTPLSYGLEGTASLFESDFIFDLPHEFTGAEINVVSDTYLFIPAPGSAGALVLLAATGSRRRRPPS